MCERCMNHDFCKGTGCGPKKALKEFIEQNRWIPVSERLPRTKGKYLVCGKKGGIYIAEFVCESVNGTPIGPWWHATGRYCPEPIAWRPLPQPYEGGEDDE